MILNKGDTMIKSNRYRFIYDSYDDNIKHAVTNNIEIKQYERKNCNKIVKIILE